MVVSMSEKEFSRLGVLMDVEAGRLRVDDAAQLLMLKRRQVFRLLEGLRTDGAAQAPRQTEQQQATGRCS